MTVQDQIRLWELERQRLKADEVPSMNLSSNTRTSLEILEADRRSIQYAYGTRYTGQVANLAKSIVLSNAFAYGHAPPAITDLLSTLAHYDVPNQVYIDPFYSKESDVPEKPWEFAGLMYHLKGGSSLGNLKGWNDGTNMTRLTDHDRNVFLDWFDGTGVGGWEYASTPPSTNDVRLWLKEDSDSALSRKQASVTQVFYQLVSLIFQRMDL